MRRGKTKRYPKTRKRIHRQSKKHRYSKVTGMNGHLNGHLNGGKVIGSGGFGCVLSPVLTCDNKDLNTGLGLNTKNKISKIMLKQYAVEEYKDIKKYANIIHRIPNYNNYFIIDNISICAPNKLSPADLINYDEKCFALNSFDITSSNINSNLNKLAILNEPNGGIEIDDYIITNFLNIPLLKKMNTTLINLLLHGIIPMNKLHVYHLDVKGSNILYDGIHSRLIDWGLSYYFTNPKIAYSLVTEISHRPFHFNLPYSIIIFHTHFIHNYDKFLTFSKPTKANIQGFVLKYLNKLSESENGSHIHGVISDFNSLFKGKFTMNTIASYISTILFRFTLNNTLELAQYFPIFLKNVDVWGFVISYLSFIDIVQKQDAPPAQLQIVQHLKSAIELLLKYNTTAINIKELVTILNKINNV